MRRASIKLMIKLTEKFYNSIITQTLQKQTSKRDRPKKYRLSKRCSSKRYEKLHSRWDGLWIKKERHI